MYNNAIESLSILQIHTKIPECIHVYKENNEEVKKKKNEKQNVIKHACIAKEVVTLKHNREDKVYEYSFTRRLHRPFSFIPETRRKG